MTAKDFRDVWTFTDAETQQSAGVAELRGASGALLDREHLLLSANDGGDEGWCSVPRADVEKLRDALSAWLEETAP